MHGKLRQFYVMHRFRIFFETTPLRHILQQINKKIKLVWGAKWKQHRLREIVIYIPNDDMQNNQ